jgi:hypothetical protein
MSGCYSSRPSQLSLSAGSRSVRRWRIDPDRYPVTFLDVIRRRQIDDLKRSFPRRVVSARRRVILRHAPVISASEDPAITQDRRGYAALSATPFTPECCAQWAQQYTAAPACTP